MRGHMPSPAFHQKMPAPDTRNKKESLVNGMKDHVHAIEYSGTPQEVHVAMRMDAYDWYKTNLMRPGPRFQKDVLWFMATHPRATRDWTIYVAERI